MGNPSWFNFSSCHQIPVRRRLLLCVEMAVVLVALQAEEGVYITDITEGEDTSWAWATG